MAELEIAVKTIGVSKATAELQAMEKVLKAQGGSVELTGKDLEQYNLVMGKTEEVVKKTIPPVKEVVSAQGALMMGMKGLRHEVPGLNMAIALMRNSWLGIGVVLAGVIKLAVDYIKSTHDMAAAEVALSAGLRNAAAARKTHRDLMLDEIEAVPALVDALQKELDKRKEAAEWAEKQNKNALELAKLKIDQAVVDGKMTAGQGANAKDILGENTKRAAHDEKVSALKNAALVSENQAANLRATVIPDAEAVAAAAKKEAHSRAESLATGPSAETIAAKEKKLTEEQTDWDKWNSLPLVEKAMNGPLSRRIHEMQTGGIPAETRFATEEKSIQKQREALENNTNARDETARLQKEAEDDVKAKKALEKEAREGAVQLRKTLAAEETEGAKTLEGEIATDRAKTRLELSKAAKEANDALAKNLNKPPGPLDKVGDKRTTTAADEAETERLRQAAGEAGDALGDFDKSVAPAPPPPRRGLGGFIPMAQTRVNRAAMTVGASEYGLSMAEAGGNPVAIDAWKAQAEVAQRELAAAAAALAANSRAIAAFARQQAATTAANTEGINALNIRP